MGSFLCNTWTWSKEFESKLKPQFVCLRSDEPTASQQARKSKIRERLDRNSTTINRYRLHTGDLAFEIETTVGNTPVGSMTWPNHEANRPRVVQTKGDFCLLETSEKLQWFNRSQLASFDELEHALTSYLRDHPNDSYGWQLLASYRMMAGRYDDAISDMTRAIRLNPRNAGFYSFRAALWILRMQLEPAIADCNEAIFLEPNNPEPVGLRSGAYYIVAGDSLRALRDLEEVVRLGKRDPEVIATCGGIKAANGKYADAIQDFTTALGLVPNDSVDRSQQVLNYFWFRAAARAELQEFDAAIGDLTRAIKLSPTFEILYFSRAQYQYRLGNYSKAIDDYNLALRLNAELTEARIYRGAAFIQLGDLDKAIEAFSEELRRDANSFDAYMGRGLARHNKKEFDLAIVD